MRRKAEAGYDSWLRSRLPNEEEDSRQRKESFPFMPVLSILVPAYETPEDFLRQMMDSVLDQSYGNLELCIADGSPSDKVQRVVEPYMEQDRRIRYRRLAKNQGISGNTNEALALAEGDYVGLLDHDDILLPGALYEIVKAVNEAGGADAVYTDEDKVTMDLGRHFQPHFKPDFNMEYLCSNNYICHFFLVKREIACQAGGFHGEFDGAQDHDFIFRCTELAKKVIHIPKVLYSWRCHEASTADNPESKLYAYEAGKRAVKAHLQRTGQTGEVLDTQNYGFYRIQYPTDYKEILINSFENLDGQNGVKVVYYDKARNNFVTFFGKSDYVLFTCVREGSWSKDFFRELISSCGRKEVGIACAKVYDRKGGLSSDLSMAGVSDPFGGSMKGLRKGYLGYFHRAELQQELSEPTDCFLVKGSLLEGMESFTVLELCEKVRKQGYKMVYNPWAVLYEAR